MTKHCNLRTRKFSARAALVCVRELRWRQGSLRSRLCEGLAHLDRGRAYTTHHPVVKYSLENWFYTNKGAMHIAKPTYLHLYWLNHKLEFHTDNPSDGRDFVLWQLNVMCSQFGERSQLMKKRKCWQCQVNNGCYFQVKVTHTARNRPKQFIAGKSSFQKIFVVIKCLPG